MTEGEKEFLKLIISKLHGKHVFSSNGQNDITFGIKDIEIDNAMVDSGEHDKVLKRLSNHRNNQNQAILVN
jgi:translation elongation factor EF-1beta